jgi:hypothetical protein
VIIVSEDDVGRWCKRELDAALRDGVCGQES